MSCWKLMKRPPVTKSKKLLGNYQLSTTQIDMLVIKIFKRNTLKSNGPMRHSLMFPKESLMIYMVKQASKNLKKIHLEKEETSGQKCGYPSKSSTQEEIRSTASGGERSANTAKGRAISAESNSPARLVEELGKSPKKSK